eukprot:gene19157-25765_t
MFNSYAVPLLGPSANLKQLPSLGSRCIQPPRRLSSCTRIGARKQDGTSDMLAELVMSSTILLSGAQGVKAEEFAAPSDVSVKERVMQLENGSSLAAAPTKARSLRDLYTSGMAGKSASATQENQSPSSSMKRTYDTAAAPSLKAETTVAAVAIKLAGKSTASA